MADPSTVRAFIALALDAPVRAAVEEATADLRRVLGDRVRWTATETLHVTVRFLGELAEPTLAALRAELHARASGCAAVELRLTGAGAFPPRGRPHVLWVGIDPTAALTALHAAVEDAVAAVGLPSEARRFRPDLTIGRPRAGAGIADPELRDALSRVGFVATERVASLHLMRSELTPGGARHSVLDDVPLVGRPAVVPRGGPGPAIGEAG